jgi:hypothetical protein
MCFSTVLLFLSVSIITARRPLTHVTDERRARSRRRNSATDGGGAVRENAEGREIAAVVRV